MHFLRWVLLPLGLLLLVGPPSKALAQVSFAPQTTFATGLTPVAVALGDLDGDGDLDMVVANSASAPPTVSVLLGNGTGGFGAQTTFAVGNTPNDVALGNLNAGAALDLVVPNGADDTVSVGLGSCIAGFGS